MSRYRSTRQKAATQPSAPSTAAPPTSFSDPAVNNSIQRSRSRYRRNQQNGTSTQPLPPGAADAVAARPRQQAQPNGRGQTQPGAQPARKPHPLPSPPAESRNLQPPTNGSLPVRTKTSRDAVRPGRDASPDERARWEARRLMDKEAERQRRLRDQIAAQKEKERVRQREQDDTRRREDEAAARARRKEDEEARREADESIARQRQDAARRTRYQRDANHTTGDIQRQNSWEARPELKSSGSRELFGMFKRKRGEESRKPQPQTKTESKPIHAQPYSAPFQDAPVSQNPHGMDAPISAVNAGERQVLIEFNGKSLYLPVTPTTTPVDLMQSAAIALGGKMDPRTSVLMENFGKVGVQRPLRKYEHVRDAMKSWDDDRQNSLLLVPSATGGNDKELEVSSVPSSQPEEFACQLSYSQRPGKWDKRWITLRQDGQVTVAKKQGMKQSDQTNVCHLSDFDIYTPAPKQLTRRIRPPKKHCFAIKSQQKSNLFESMEMFVHFFCCNDKKVAALFYRAVQGWRSWYLVNVMGEGQKKKAEPRTSNGANGTNLARNGTAHGRVASDESHYQIGTFKPLIDLDVFSNQNSNSAPDLTATRPRGRSNSASHGQGFSFATNRARTSSGRNGPPSAYPNNLANGDHNRQHSNSNPTSPSDTNTFAPSGLLGRTYSKRQADMQSREHDRSHQMLTASPSLTKTTSNTLEPPRRPSIDRTNFNTASDPTLKRSSSQRKPGKPLVDLTPQYREPPQHANRGRGFHPQIVGIGGLVDSATTPEDPVNAPPSTAWQAHKIGTVKRPNTSAANGGAEGFDRSMSLARGKSVRKPGTSGNGGGTRLEDAWKGEGQGFEQGSLLDKVQRDGREHFSEGRAGMKWDRSRAEERVVAYGEAA